MYLHNEHAFCDLHFFSFCYDYPFFDHDRMGAQCSIGYNQQINVYHFYTSIFHLTPEPHVSVLILNIIMHSFMGCWRSTWFMKLCSLSQMSLSLQVQKLFLVSVLQQCTYLNVVIFNHLFPWIHVHSR